MLSSVRFVDLGVDSKRFEASGTVKPCTKQCSVLRGELGLMRSTRAKHTDLYYAEDTAQRWHMCHGQRLLLFNDFL